MKLKGHGRKPKTKKVVPAGGEASTSSSNVIPLETTHEPSKISEAAPPPIALKPAATSSSATPTVIPNIAAAGRLLAPPKWAETKPTSSTIKQEPIGFSPNRHLQSANGVYMGCSQRQQPKWQRTSIKSWTRRGWPRCAQATRPGKGPRSGQQLPIFDNHPNRRRFLSGHWHWRRGTESARRAK